MQRRLIARCYTRRAPETSPCIRVLSSMTYRGPAFLFMLLVSAGCTTIGSHTGERLKVDYGPAQSLEICLLRSPGVTEKRVDELIAAVNEEFRPYGITVQVPWIRDWNRPGFTASTIMDDLLQRDLETPCDRLVGLVDRNAGDFLWGLLLPEVLGAVEDVTRTHGYVVATFGSLNQAFMDPRSATVHEFYHLVGCPHGLTMSKCYRDIAAMKASTPAGSDFFPGLSKDGRYLLTRDEVNAAMEQFLAEAAAAKQGKVLPADGGVQRQDRRGGLN